ncbi:hypothetical protein [Amycolatopsis taiwanensis]|uniref:hypothetical protein n=1 Tax=Amycolatopsis taiwanensis TaxID=342230 RepID=UPI000486D21B|nr:hypothetical protein [Amycolatopsis taiwanensis]
MSIVPVLWEGPDTCEVSAAVTGGQLVVPDGTTGKVKPAGAGATNVLGVALTDAQPAGSAPTNPISTAWPDPYTSVADDVDVRVTYAAAANYGDRLKAAANGQVTPFVGGTDTDFRLIIGRCTEPKGVASGAVGRARIDVQ